MSLRILIPLATLVALSSSPAFGQCGPGHGGHGGHGGHDSGNSHARHEEPAPKVTATNKVCPVMGRPVKAGRDMQVVVGGNTYLVCCPGCGPEMAEHKEKYLGKDGKPLNAPKEEDPKKEEPKPEPAPQAPHKH